MTQAHANGSIIVGVSLKEGRDEAALFGAQALARRFGWDLTLVHALDWGSLRPWISHYPGEYLDPEISQRAEDLARKEAHAKLHEIARRLGNDPQPATEVTVGNAAEALAEEAEKRDSCLIVTGAAGRSHWYVPRGASTALGLLYGSQRPVLVVKDSDAVDWTKTGFRVLMADDLTPGAQTALKTSFHLAEAFNSSHLRHVHVYGSPSEQLRDLAYRFVEVAGSLFEKKVEAGQLYKHELDKRRKALAERAETYKAQWHGAKDGYAVALVQGDAEDHLTEEARLFGADLAVYGRHKLIHRDPFSFGKIPFHEMLKHECPVLMVPPEAEHLVQAVTERGRGKGAAATEGPEQSVHAT